MDTLRAWPLLTVTTDIISQSIMLHAQYIHHVPFQMIMLTLSLHPFSFNVHPILLCL